MKLSELIKEVNKDIDDSLSNADITGWLNRAIDDLTPIAKYKKSQTISLVVDQKDYTLPSDLQEIVFLMDDKQLPQISLYDMNGTGYKVWGNTLTIQPTPDEAKDLTLYYHAKLPRLVNSDDEPVIRSDFHDLLVLYAVAKAKYQDEEPGLQESAWNEYLIRKQQFAAEMNEDAEVHQVRLVT